MGKAKKATKKVMPKRPVRGAAKAKALPKPAVVVNEAMRKRYEAHLAAFRKAQGAELGHWDAAYESLDEILGSEPPLYLAGGFKSERAFLAAVLPGVARSTVRENVRVARHFDPDQEKKHGVRRLAMLVDYLEAKSGAELPRARIDADRTKVEVKGERVPFTEVDYDALRDAARTAKGKAGGAKTAPPEERALRAIFSSLGLGNVSVQHRADRWSFGRIERRQFKDLGTAFARAAKAG